MKNKKLVVITGPTGSGKTALAIKVALWLNSEIISADSKQVYKKLDIATDKVDLSKEKVPHHLISIISPTESFSTAQFKNLAEEKIKEIQQKGKVPILCGGTYFYIKAVIDGLQLPKIAPDWEFRKEKEKLSAEELFNQLKIKDPRRAQNIDKHNKRRLIRALEIIKKTKKPVPKSSEKDLNYPVLVLAIEKEKDLLHKNIEKRIDQMVKKGLENEAKTVTKKFPKIAKETIGYKEWIEYFQEKKRRDEVIEEIKISTKQFAKRQKSWLKRDKKIIWIKTFTEAKKEIKKYLN